MIMNLKVPPVCPCQQDCPRSGLFWISWNHQLEFEQGRGVIYQGQQNFLYFLCDSQQSKFKSCTWVLAKWILDWGHQEPQYLLLKENKLWHMLMETWSLSHCMFMAWNEIHSGEQMVQAFQWVDGIVRRLKAMWFTDCAQVFCEASLEVPWNKGLPWGARFTSVA